ncbi:Ubiquitin-specific protease, partial [Globisporangium splendens]
MRARWSSRPSSSSSSKGSWWQWWWWLLPVPFARALQQLLYKLMSAWLNSPLRRLRVGAPPVPKRLAFWDGDDEEAEGEADDAAMVKGGDGDGGHVAKDAAATATTSKPLVDATGLVNVGNTCFVNAILQCLAALPSLHTQMEHEIERLERTQHDDSNENDVRKSEKQEQRLQMTRAMLTLLKTLGPESFEEQAVPSTTDDGDVDNRVQKKRRQDSGRMNGDSSAFCSSRSPRRHNRDAVTAQLRVFLDAAQQCTNLIAAKYEQQDQQDAEAAAAAVPASPTRSERNESEYFRQGEEFYAAELKKCTPLNPHSYIDVVSNLGEFRWQRFLKTNDSVVTDLFVGQIVRGSQCCSCANLTCLHQELRYEGVFFLHAGVRALLQVLSLNISASAASQSLLDCLETYRHAEHLVDENRVFCDGYCHIKTSRITQVLFQRAPPILVIQLQRFKQSSWGSQLERIGVPVRFPVGENELLDITENMFVRDEAQRVLYKLVAVCSHMGNSIDSGHYVGYVKHEAANDGSHWLRMDDDVVTVLDEAQFRCETLSTAYILFYTRVG